MAGSVPQSAKLCKAEQFGPLFRASSGPNRFTADRAWHSIRSTLTQGTWPFNLKAKVGSNPTPDRSRFQCDCWWRMVLVPAALAVRSGPPSRPHACWGLFLCEECGVGRKKEKQILRPMPNP